MSRAVHSRWWPPPGTRVVCHYEKFLQLVISIVPRDEINSPTHVFRSVYAATLYHPISFGDVETRMAYPPSPSTPHGRLLELEGERASQALELERLTSLRDAAIEKATQLEVDLEAASSKVKHATVMRDMH